MTLRPTKIVYLDTDQIQQIESLVQLRLTEVSLAQENPRIIDLYSSILLQLRMGK